MELMKQQRYYLTLFVRTSPAQRKALLRTITRPQLRALSQIAHNVIKSTVRLKPDEKKTLRRYRRIVHLLGDRKTGFETKRRAISNRTRLVYTLTSVALAYLEPVLWKN